MTVTRTGRRPFGEEVTLARGEARSVDVELGVTGQRVASYLLTGAAGASVIVGGALVGMAFHEQGVAESIQTMSRSRNISQGMQDDYTTALGSRDDLKRAAEGVFGGAVALGLAAGVLFTFDTPRPPSTFVRVDEGPARKAPAPVPLEVSVLPVLGPGVFGAGVVGRF